MGFPGYFLVVADFINWAKNQGIRVGPGRGSGAGSMVAYAMRITELDPLEHGLLFERLLNPERVSMPHFDVDFDDRRRGEVIEYVERKYGDDRIAQVITYGVMKTKNSLKDAARVLDYPYSMGDRLSKALPPTVMGKDISVKGIFDPEDKRYAEAGEVRRLHDEDPDVQQVVEIAQGGARRTRGAAAGRDGQGHLRQGDLRPRGQAVRRGGGVPPHPRRGPRRAEGGRDRQGRRGPHPRLGRARLRRDHVQPPSGGHRADDAPSLRRPDHHPVRVPHPRDPGPAEDGLPGAAQPHRALRRGREHGAQRQD